MSKKKIKLFLLTKPTKKENFSILQFHFKCPICLKNFTLPNDYVEGNILQCPYSTETEGETIFNKSKYILYN